MPLVFRRYFSFPLLELFFQYPFQNLACGVARQLVFEVNLFGNFEICQLCAYMVADGGFIQFDPFFELDKGNDFFISVLVFYADDGSGFDGIEFVNRLFDFAWINVLPFGNNQVFFAVDDKDETVFVYRDKIACFQPAVDDASSVASHIFR